MWLRMAVQSMWAIKVAWLKLWTLISSIYLSLLLSVYLSVSDYVCPSRPLLSVCMSLTLPLSLSLSVSVSLSISVCLSVSLYLWCIFLCLWVHNLWLEFVWSGWGFFHSRPSCVAVNHKYEVVSWKSFQQHNISLCWVSEWVWRVRGVLQWSVLADRLPLHHQGRALIGGISGVHRNPYSHFPEWGTVPLFMLSNKLHMSLALATDFHRYRTLGP